MAGYEKFPGDHAEIPIITLQSQLTVTGNWRGLEIFATQERTETERWRQRIPPPRTWHSPLPSGAKQRNPAKTPVPGIGHLPLMPPTRSS